MAPSPRLISFLFLLTIFSKQIHARESQFFSKVSATTATPSTTTINNNNVQDKTLPSKQEESFNKQELDPAFIPDTQNGYGLYGQESSRFPTTTKLANAPYTTTTYQPYKTQTQTQETYTNYPTDSTTTTTNNHYNNNGYEEQQQNFGETSLQGSEYTNMGNQNNNKYYNGANSYNNKYYNGANSYTNDEKQGMSDTRYLANGKYYYDLNNENSNYYRNQYQQNSRNNYNTRGYYNNNNNNNDENSKYEYNNNSMQKYDNQDDFEESQEEQYVP
ncbi:hypothetical protein D5086_008091 [Populus alba]|uniref:Protein E6-like n=3 Tax=Populus TaxID=3689 RepID=A0A4U5PM27_POPAL|nr:protein E6-like [Populus alba]KAJ6999880.1 protein E6-like [Populus alba x Populus x berolinensis]TKR98019.1 protein E6-like [Populus alba]